MSKTSSQFGTETDQTDYMASHQISRKPSKKNDQLSLFQTFNSDYTNCINTAEDQSRPLSLLEALLELGFFNKQTRNLRGMRTSKKNILLTGNDNSNIVQENLYKVLCAILGLQPT